MTTKDGAAHPGPAEPAARRGPGRRRLDVVVFGATGFVGRLTAAHLAAHAPDGVRIGLAARSPAKLAAVRAGLGPVAESWPLLVADSADPTSLTALAQATTVVATTVGPYAKYGLPLVAACAGQGTHCVDLAGEVLFVRRSIDLAHEAAQATGARIVHSCGFDSVPSDLAVLCAHERARADDAGELTDTTFVLVSARGGFSGGTIDSLRNQVDEVSAQPALRRLLVDPYALSSDRVAEPQLGPEPDSSGVQRDRALGMWTAPFVMAPHNTRIVRRSNALLGWAYGRRFRYREVMSCGSSALAPVFAAGVTVGLRAVGTGLAFGPARVVLDRVLAKPGQRPDERARTAGHFRVDVHATTTRGRRYVVTVSAAGDPGYAATAVMLGQSALCLALDGASLPRRAGVLTPATAMGSALVKRLREQGFQITVAPE